MKCAHGVLNVLNRVSNESVCCPQSNTFVVWHGQCSFFLRGCLHHHRVVGDGSLAKYINIRPYSCRTYTTCNARTRRSLRTKMKCDIYNLHRMRNKNIVCSQDFEYERRKNVLPRGQFAFYLAWPDQIDILSLYCRYT